MPKSTDRTVLEVIDPNPITLALPEGVPYHSPPGEAGVNELKQISGGLVQNATDALWTVRYSNGDIEQVSLASMNQPVEVRKSQALVVKNLFLVTAVGEVDDGSDPALVTGPDNVFQLIPGGVLKPEAEVNQSIMVQLLAYVNGPDFGLAAHWKYAGNDRAWALVDPEKAVMLSMANDTGLAIQLHAES